jgi:predicted HTH domain antitoxin
MEILINVPDDVAGQLGRRWKDLPRRALEALVADAYRDGALTAFQVQELLGLPSRWETDAFLKRKGAYLDYTEEDLEADLQAARGIARRGIARP